jgi:hypothetical protein
MLQTWKHNRNLQKESLSREQGSQCTMMRYARTSFKRVTLATTLRQNRKSRSTRTSSQDNGKYSRRRFGSRHQP